MPVIRIRGMPFNAQKSDIIEFLAGVKIVNKEKGIHFIQRHPVKPSGEAYVEVLSKADEDEALKKHKEYMSSRYIEVFASTQEELDRYLSSQTNCKSRDAVIRIRGLPYDISKPELVKIFRDVEIVPNGLALIMDHSGFCTGEGYMRIFPSRFNIDSALAKDAYRIGRRPIEVKESSMEEADAHIKYQIDRNRMLKRPMMGGYGYTAGGYPPDPYTSPYPPQPPMKYSRDRSPLLPRKSTGYCIYMRGLPFESNLKDVEDFFHPIRVLDVRFSKGDAFAEFESYEDVEEAMKRDRGKIGHRYIELFKRCEDGPDPDQSREINNRRDPMTGYHYKPEAPCPVPPPNQSYYDPSRY